MIQDILLEIFCAQEQFYAIDSTNKNKILKQRGGGGEGMGSPDRGGKYSKRKQSAVNSPA
jgi:hypothetical protein